jgi:hypothetical protein
MLMANWQPLSGAEDLGAITGCCQLLAFIDRTLTSSQQTADLLPFCNSVEDGATASTAHSLLRSDDGKHPNI